MPDTHINAYFVDVTEAEKKVLLAQAALQEAKDRLEVKKLEVGFEESEPSKVKPEQASTNPTEEAPDPKPGEGSFFKKSK